MSYLSFYLLSADADKKPRLEQQHLDATNSETIVCRCGLMRHLTMAFRCLYCGEWFCFTCAESHFGQTVQEWRDEKRSKLRDELNDLTTEQIKERIRSRAVH